MSFVSSNHGFHRALMKGNTLAPKNGLASSFSMAHYQAHKKQPIILEDSSCAGMKQW